MKEIISLIVLWTVTSALCGFALLGANKLSQSLDAYDAAHCVPTKFVERRFGIDKRADYYDDTKDLPTYIKCISA